jgi:hypothetical protein
VASARVLSTAEAVYGPRPFHADAVALGLSGIVAQPGGLLARASSEMVRRLEWLANEDPEWTDFYRSRIRHFESLHADGGLEAQPDLDLLQQRVAAAIDQGKFAEIDSLTSSVLSAGKNHAPRLWIPRVANERLENLAAAFSPSTVERARDMGLAEVLLPPATGLGEYVSGSAESAVFATTAPDCPASDSSCKPGRMPPPDVGPKLRESLDFLIAHPLITSAGIRYLPWFGPEAILIEDFAEQQVDANRGILDALGLPTRRGVPRLQIEDALLHRGAECCGTLGLNPSECVVVCVPFDAYQRLAPRYGWGQADLWTHLDGYQVTRDLKLLALVGGYARFGGPDDLSAISRSYDSDRVLARFAVVRRDRFFARHTGP